MTDTTDEATAVRQPADETQPGQFRAGYRQALLDIATAITISDHLGDVWDNLHAYARHAGLELCPGKDSVDLEGLREQGGRLNYELKEARI
jgi:hypothetical protein